MLVDNIFENNICFVVNINSFFLSLSYSVAFSFRLYFRDLDKYKKKEKKRKEVEKSLNHPLSYTTTALYEIQLPSNFSGIIYVCRICGLFGNSKTANPPNYNFSNFFFNHDYIYYYYYYFSCCLYYFSNVI